jgi:hypothetical protein
MTQRRRCLMLQETPLGSLTIGGVIMPMHTPSAWTFWLSVALVVLAIVSLFVRIPYISEYAFWVAVIGYVILVIGCTIKTK